MRTVIIADGDFEITDCGDVYKITNGMREEANITMAGRGQRYKMLSYKQDGKWKNEFVHRLVAKAFVPNPNQYNVVHHKDGNPTNNHYENLEWCTQKENMSYAYEAGVYAHLFTECVICGSTTMSKDSICPSCRAKQKADYKRMQSRDEKAVAVKSALDKIDMSALSPRDERVITLYAEGLTFSEIGREFGLTRERIRQLIDRIVGTNYLAYQVKKGITSNQRALADYIKEKGFNVSHMARSLNLDVARLRRMLAPTLHMPTDVYIAICEFVGFEPDT